MIHAGKEKILSITGGLVTPANGVVEIAPPPLALPRGFVLDSPPLSTAGRMFVDQGLVQAGMLTLISGPPKSRKSYLLADLAVAIAGGGSWLHHACGEPAKVLVVDLELDPHYLIHRLQRIAEDSGEAGKRAAENVRVLPWRHVTIQAGANAQRVLEAVGKEAREFKAEVVCIDSVYMLLDGDESDPVAVSSLLKSLVKLCAGAAVVFTHHFAKGSAQQQQAKNAIDRASGSSWWSRFADVLIPLTPAVLGDDDARVLLEVEPSIRHHAPRIPFMIQWADGPRFSVLTDAQHKAAKPEKKPATQTEQRQERAGKDSAPLLLSLLIEQFNGDATQAKLAKAAKNVGIAGGTFDRAVKRLEKENQIELQRLPSGANKVVTKLTQAELPPSPHPASRSLLLPF